MESIFSGVATALYTPFAKDRIDFEQLENCIDRQIKAKIDALVFLGTTGEASTVTRLERREIIKFAVSKLKGKIPIIIGAGSNCTQTACDLSVEAKTLGADCVLSVTPYYNKCEQEGILSHYKEISKTAKIPMICYNVPKRTCVNIEPKTADKLRRIDCVCGLKEASLDVSHVKNLFETIGGKLNVYCGSDELTRMFFDMGAKGVISVASNVIPLKIKEFTNDFENFYKFSNFDIDGFFKLLTHKVNPIPIKVIASVLFNEKCYFRLPLTYPNKTDFNYIIEELSRLKLKF